MPHIVTMPSASDQDVVDILALHKLTGTPAPVPYQNPNGYPAQQCHISAKHAAKYLGQSYRRVHGWAFWKFTDLSGDIVLAEFHSVVRDASDNLIDVTPPRDGGIQVLFLEDRSLSIPAAAFGSFEFRSELTPWAASPYFYQWAPWGPTFTLSQSTVLPFCMHIGLPLADFPTDPTYG